MIDLQSLSDTALDNFIENIIRKGMTEDAEFGPQFKRARLERAKRSKGPRGPNWYDVLSPRDGDVVVIGDTGEQAIVKWRGSVVKLIYNGRETALTPLRKELAAKGHSTLNGVEIDAEVKRILNEIGM